MSTDALLVECNSTIQISELVGVGRGLGKLMRKERRNLLVIIS